MRRRPATTDIKLVKSSIPLPRRTPRAQIVDDAGAEPTQKHDPREHYTADQVARVRASLVGLGE